MEKLKRNYLKVLAKCGHVERHKYISIVFAVLAENGNEASKKVRQFPRIKHNHKDAILRCDKIILEQFLQIKEINNNEPYLCCKSTHEQKKIFDLQYKLEDDYQNRKIHSKEERLDRVTYKLAKYKIINDFSKKEYKYDYVY